MTTCSLLVTRVPLLLLNKIRWGKSHCDQIVAYWLKKCYLVPCNSKIFKKNPMTIPFLLIWPRNFLLFCKVVSLSGTLFLTQNGAYIKLKDSSGKMPFFKCFECNKKMCEKMKRGVFHCVERCISNNVKVQKIKQSNKHDSRTR